MHKPEYVLPITPLVDSARCEVGNVSYRADIQPILKQHCYRCHGTPQTPGIGVDLENFDSLKSYLQLDFRGNGVYGTRLYNCMAWSTYALPMPPTYKVDTCSLMKLNKWLAEGGKDN